MTDERTDVMLPGEGKTSDARKHETCHQRGVELVGEREAKNGAFTAEEKAETRREIAEAEAYFLGASHRPGPPAGLGRSVRLLRSARFHWRRIFEYSRRMSTKKMSFTFPPGLPDAIRRAAEEQQVPVSVWMARTAEAQVQRQERRALVAEFEAENGPISAERRAKALAVLARAEARMLEGGRDTQ